MTRMLQIVVVPSYCPILKFSRDDKPSILAQHMSIFNELTFVPMLAYFSGLIYPSFVQVQFYVDQILRFIFRTYYVSSR